MDGLEILLGGDDIPCGVAPSLATSAGSSRTLRSRASPTFTRRIATFEKVAVTCIKRLVDAATLPEDDELARGLKVYFATAGRPENRPLVQLLLDNGLQQIGGVETDFLPEKDRRDERSPSTYPPPRPA